MSMAGAGETGVPRLLLSDGPVAFEWNGHVEYKLNDDLEYPEEVVKKHKAVTIASKATKLHAMWLSAM